MDKRRTGGPWASLCLRCAPLTAAALISFLRRLAGFPTFYSSTESGEASTFEKILNWRETLYVRVCGGPRVLMATQEALNEVQLSADATDLIKRFLCDRSMRIGLHGPDEIKRHRFALLGNVILRDLIWQGFSRDLTGTMCATVAHRSSRISPTPSTRATSPTSPRTSSSSTTKTTSSWRCSTSRSGGPFPSPILAQDSCKQRTAIATDGYPVHWLYVQEPRRRAVSALEPCTRGARDSRHVSHPTSRGARWAH